MFLADKFLLEIPNGIKDNVGRALTHANRFLLKIRTTGYPPLVRTLNPHLGRHPG
jgi:hypothetical protein